MRALVPLIIVGGLALLGLRLYLSYTRNVQDASRAGKILWRLLDAVLLVIGAGVVVVLVLLLLGIAGQIWQNLT